MNNVLKDYQSNAQQRSKRIRNTIMWIYMSKWADNHGKRINQYNQHVNITIEHSNQA